MAAIRWAIGREPAATSLPPSLVFGPVGSISATSRDLGVVGAAMPRSSFVGRGATNPKPKGTLMKTNLEARFLEGEKFLVYSFEHYQPEVWKVRGDLAHRWDYLNQTWDLDILDELNILTKDATDIVECGTPKSLLNYLNILGESTLRYDFSIYYASELGWDRVVSNIVRLPVEKRGPFSTLNGAPVNSKDAAVFDISVERLRRHVSLADADGLVD